MLTIENAAEHVDNAVKTLPSYPGGHQGRGIVIPAGGIRYFPCAWVCIHMLRRLGCTLPIELWHLGPKEVTDEMRRMIEPLGVETVDGMEVRKSQPVRMLHGWPLKPYAILNSAFAEVLLLDADNVPIVDPTFLFDTPQFNEFGAIFWPDFMSHTPEQLIWRLMDVPFRDEPEVESGQLVIDKQRSWQPLSLAMWMNEYADFWYEHILGDKETFHFGWRKLNASYVMPSRRIEPLYCVMCQHDFEDRRIFQHRNMAKWSLGENQRIAGFLYEDECLDFLADLRRRWHPLEGFVEGLPKHDQMAMRELCGKRFRYVREGFDERVIAFRDDGLIVEGTGGRETLWWVEGDELILASDQDDITCRLKQRAKGVWEGTWLVHERMPVRLEQLGS